MSTPRSTYRIEQIRGILRKADGNGIWLMDLSKKVGIRPPSILYYIHGKTQGGKEYGGYLKKEVEVAKRQGTNVFLRLVR